jgi:hypothetical protein
MNNKSIQNLIIGIDKEETVEISEKSRLLNLAVIGTKNSGKTTKIIPAFAKQQIQNGGNFVGCTFIVNDKEEAYFLMSLANRLKRKTQLKVIKPSADITTYKMLLEDKPYDYDEMTKLIDYKQEIRNKSIIIIDLEEEKYKDKSRRMLKKILHHLYIDIQNTEVTLKRPHYLYVDDADNYITEIGDLLKYNENYDLSTTLFLNSFTELDYDAKYLLESCVKNYILLSGLVFNDITYFVDKFSYFKPITTVDDFNLYKIQLFRELSLRTPNTIFYMTVDKGIKKCGKCAFYNNGLDDEEERISIINIGKKLKKKTIVPDNNIPFKISNEDFNNRVYNINQSLSNNSAKSTFNPINQEELPVASDNIVDAILDNIDDIPTLYRNETESFDINNLVDINPEALETQSKKKKKKKKKKKNQLSNEVNAAENLNNVVESIFTETNDVNKIEDDVLENENVSEENVEQPEEESENDIINIVEEASTDIEDDSDIDAEENNDFTDIIENINNSVVSTPDVINTENEVIDYSTEDDNQNISEETVDENYISDNDDEDMIINIERKYEEPKIKTIDDEFDNSLEKLADAEEEQYNNYYPDFIPDYAYDDFETDTTSEDIISVEEEKENSSDDKNQDKAFFDIDSLFDDENEEN